MRWLKFLLALNVLFSAAGGFLGSQKFAQIFLTGNSVATHRIIVVLSFTAMLFGAALAFLLPFQREFKVRIKRSGSDQEPGQPRKVELVFDVEEKANGMGVENDQKPSNGSGLFDEGSTR